MVNGGVYINNDGIETFLKNIKDISDSFDNIQKRIKKVKNSLENDFDGITPTIIDCAQTCVDLSDRLKKNADYIHSKSGRIVKIAEDAELKSLAKFDALEAIKQRIASLLASVGSFITPFYALGAGVGLGSVVGGLLGGGSGNSSYGVRSQGGGESGGNRDLKVGPKVEFGYRSKDNAPKWFSETSYEYDAEKNEDEFKLKLFSKEDSVSAIHITDEQNYGGVRINRATDIGNAKYSGEVGVKTDGNNVAFEGELSGSATAFNDNLNVRVGSEDNNVALNGEVALLTVGAKVAGEAGIGTDGINVNVKAEAEATTAEISLEVVREDKSSIISKESTKLEGKVLTASASAKAGYSKEDGFEAKASAEASVGKATATKSVEFLGGIFTIEVTAGVNAGVGAEVGISSEEGKYKLQAEAAALGDVGVAVTVDTELIASEENVVYQSVSQQYEMLTGDNYQDNFNTGMDIILDSNPLGQWIKNELILKGY